jgi:hypothetical protein
VSFKPGSDFISKLGSVLNSGNGVDEELGSVLNSGNGVDEAEVDAEAVVVVVVVTKGS